MAAVQKKVGLTAALATCTADHVMVLQLPPWTCILTSSISPPPGFQGLKAFHSP